MFMNGEKIAPWKKSGFTLLELLVVVSIVAFLATITLVALGSAQSQARDTRRQLDTVTVIKAVDLKYSDDGTVPQQWIPPSASATLRASGNTPRDTTEGGR